MDLNSAFSLGGDAQKDQHTRSDGSGSDQSSLAFFNDVYATNAAKAAAPKVEDKPAASLPKAEAKSLEQILNGHSSPEPHTRILADSYGRVTNMALMLCPYADHLDKSKRSEMLGAYKTLFTEMEPDTKFTIVVQTDQDKAEVEKMIADNHVAHPERITFLKPDVGDLTIWARDMMVGMYTPDDPKHTALLNQTTLHSWHLSDIQVPGRIAAANPSIVLDKEPFVVTDGGDVESNTREAFTGYYSVVSTEIKMAEALAKDPALKTKVFDYYKQHYGKDIVEPAPGDLHFPYVKAPRTDGNDTNLGSFQLVRDPAFHRDDAGPGKVTEQQALEDLAVRLISDRFDKPVQVMGRDDPKHPGKEMDPASDHLDMACTPVDDKTFLVGDPSLAKQTFAAMTPAEKLQVEKVLSAQAGHPVKLPDAGRIEPHNSNDQEGFDAYAHILENKGYKVLRVPHLAPVKEGEPYISYNNCLMERFEKDGKEVRRVFLPHYGVQQLDDLADKAWKSQGFDVHPIPLGALSAEWGALRCVTNWLDRMPRG